MDDLNNNGFGSTQPTQQQDFPPVTASDNFNGTGFQQQNYGNGEVPTKARQGKKTNMAMIIVIAVAVISAVVVGLILSAPKEKAFYGKWKAEVDATDFAIDAFFDAAIEANNNPDDERLFNELRDKIKEDFVYKYYIDYTFNEDNTYERRLDEESVTKALNGFVEKYKEYFKPAAIKAIREQNPESKDYSDEYIWEAYGGDEAFFSGIDEAVKSGDSLTQMKAEVDSDGEYGVEGDMVYFTNMKTYVETDSDKLAFKFTKKSKNEIVVYKLHQISPEVDNLLDVSLIRAD